MLSGAPRAHIDGIASAKRRQVSKAVSESTADYADRSISRSNRVDGHTNYFLQPRYHSSLATEQWRGGERRG